MTSTYEDLRSAGFALHWLRSKSKAPIEKDWSEAPVLTVDQLRATHLPGYNLGVRLGEPSIVGEGYLHVFDIDIRIADLADEAWAALSDLFPGIDLDDLPCVQSGSGGESRHLYFITDKPFRSKKLWTSEGKHRRPDGRWSYDAEIELFGTGKQVVLPPSIHPDSGRPYVWLREFDFAVLDLGIGPFIPSAAIERLAVAEHATYEFETREPLTFTAAQLERTLSAIPDERIDDRNDWIMLGQALHHQFGGSEEGFQLWMEHSKRGSKFLVGSNERAELRRYRSFGRNRRQPVTMASVIEWGKDARIAALRNAFDEEDEPAAATEEISQNALSSATLNAAATTEEIDDIDAIGSATAAALIAEGSSTAVGLEWMSLLDINEEGGIKGTLHNLRLIVENDARTSGVVAFNEFTQEVVQRGEPGTLPPKRRNPAKPTLQLIGQSWIVHDKVNGDFWTEDKDNSIRAVIEAPKSQGGYGVKVADRDLRAAIDIASRACAFHPVREYLSLLKWDGTARAENLFIDYLGAPDDVYHRSVARILLLAAVARVHEPGMKFDSAVILECVQGKRKSTFISVLAKEWFVELDGDVTDTKQMVEVLQGAWIAELNELGGIAKADVRHIKAFISRRSDKVRLAYAKRAQEYRRQSVLVGSTNDNVYLRDQTGGRRFLPVRCEIGGEIDTDRLSTQIDQIWAEAMQMYHAMRERQPVGVLPLYITDPVARGIAERLQESRKVEVSEDALAGRIEEWLSKPIVDGSMDTDFDDNGEPNKRNEVCLLQIWCDCLGRDEGQYTGMWPAALGRAMRMIPGWTESARRPRFGKYGQQRAFQRDGWIADAVLPKHG